jgi:hypothetical protein
MNFNSIFNSMPAAVPAANIFMNTQCKGQRRRIDSAGRRSADAAIHRAEDMTGFKGLTCFQNLSGLIASEVARPTSEVAVLTSEVAVLTSEVAVLTSEVAVLTSEVAVPASEVAVPASEVAVPASEVAVPASEVAVLTSEVAVLTSEVAVLTSEVARPASEDIFCQTQRGVFTKPALDRSGNLN